MVMILQVININEDLKKDIIQFLLNINSVTEIDEEILTNGVAILDENLVKGYITYEKFCEYGLIRYFIFQKNLSPTLINDMFLALINKAKADEIESFVSIGKKDNFLINGQNIKGTELEDAQILKFDIE